MYDRFSHWVVTFHEETLEVVALRAAVVGTSQLPPGRAVCELGCSSPIRCARHEEDFFLLGASSAVWDCMLIRRPAKDAHRNRELCLGRLQGKTFGHQKMAFESTL
jgi:hypothetical protein